MNSVGEEHEFWREGSLLYQAKIGYQDLEDWFEWRISEHKKARRLAKKKAALTSLRKRVRERMLATRKSRREEKTLREEEIRRLVDTMDRAANRMFLLSFLPVAIVLIISMMVTEFWSLGLLFLTLVMVFAIDPLSNVSLSADIPADVVGKVIHEHKEEIAKKNSVRPVKAQNLNINKRAISSTVDAELRAIRNKKNRRRK
ncbi:hypothetical protein IKX64_00080 [Candidatus Saccharibacteria bacterium]|nr:hypothetical protein [Candidatus Saccharibacteria bacterium]